jgi:hypothetical protein
MSFPRNTHEQAPMGPNLMVTKGENGIQIAILRFSAYTIVMIPELR